MRISRPIHARNNFVRNFLSILANFLSRCRETHGISTANLGASAVFRVLGFGVPQLLDYYLKVTLMLVPSTRCIGILQKGKGGRK
jgi:hypothetical protein